MLIPDKDLSSLLDIYNYCVIVNDIVKKMKYYHFAKDKPSQMAVERGIMIIGEASNRLSEKTQETLSFIPWREIIGMWNRIVHEYSELQLSLIWQTSKISIPKLLKQISSIEQLKEFIDKDTKK